MLVKYWMRKDVATVDVNDSMYEAVKRLKERDVPLLPVLREGHLVGVITDRDLKRASASDATSLDVKELAYLLAKIRVGEIMTRGAITVPPDYTLEETAAVLMANEVSSVPVVDEKGQIIGLISQRELFRALISLTGLEKRGVQFAFLTKDQPGAVKELTDVVRAYGGRLVSVLTSLETAPAGYRHVYLRTFLIDRERMQDLIDDLRAKAPILYLVDHREGTRVEFPEHPECRRGSDTCEAAGKGPAKKILFCSDFSENSVRARCTAVDYAKAMDADLIILHVVNARLWGYPMLEGSVVTEMAELARKIDDRVAEEIALVAGECREQCRSVRTYVRTGEPSAEIIRFAENLPADLIVMGTHGWSGFKHLILGSTAENVARMASCPVLVVKSTE